jgi:ectoine hydroxylase
MQLSDTQVAQFDEQGYLFFPGLLDNDEVAVLQRAMPELLNRQGPEVIREKEDPTAARLVFGAHVYSEPFRCLSLLPRLLNPVRQLLRDDVYLHQSRLNPKQGFGGGAAWDWHQDFPPWHYIDGMREPRCIMAAVFIDDCTEVKSPLLVLPGTHHDGLLDSKRHKEAKGYALHHIDHATLERLAEEKGIEALIGPAGSVCFIHCNILHGSANNVSPWRRAIMYLNYNAVSNACTGTDRAWHHNNRDFTPLQPLNDDCLKALA